MEMCISIETEKTARWWVAEVRKSRLQYGWDLGVVRDAIRLWQQDEGWLLDYDLTTCERIVKVEPVWKKGMKKVMACILEISKTPVLCPEERAKAKARSVA